MKQLLIVKAALLIMLAGTSHVLANDRLNHYHEKSIAETPLPIKGKIVNKEGSGLPGVSVVAKSGAATITDEAGEFSLNVPAGDVLTISYVGFTTQTVQVSEGLVLNITLEEINNNLEEVIIVGYGTQKRINVAGAVDQLKADQITKRPVSNIVQGLQGMSPNFNVGFSNGAPGSQASLNVRGFTSISGGGSPLIIIDGAVANTWDLYSINQTDIENISILRDASSAAIYGARAAYGVVLVTTKGGKTGRNVINYNNFFTSSRPSVVPSPITDPYVYSRLLQISTENTPWVYVTFDDEYYSWAKQRSENPSVDAVRLNPNGNGLWQYMGNTNWNDYFLNKSAFSQQHTISLSGGTGSDKPVNYYLSAGYTKENGLLKLARDDWRRYNARAKVDFKPYHWLKLENNIQIYQTERITPNVLSNVNNYGSLFNLVPTDVPKNPDGTWTATTGGRLAASIANGGIYAEKTTGFQNIARVTTSFLKGDLTLNAQASIRRELYGYDRNSQVYTIGYGPTDIRQEGAGGVGSVSVTNGLLTHDIYDLYATYNKKLNDHSVQFLAGFNQENYEYRATTVSANGLISSSTPFIGLTTGEITKGAAYTSYSLQGFFGRFNYTFKDRYIFEANGRYDGSSRFLPGDKWGFFPSLSGAWVVDKESFFDNFSHILSSFKLRASYGWLGNQNTTTDDATLYRINDRLPTGISPYLIGGNLTTVVGSAPPLAINPNTYTWEKVNTLNLGTDIAALNNKLTASFDYYIRKTTGMRYTPRIVPAVMGTSAPPENNADSKTWGWELTLGYRNNFNIASKPLTFNARFILSDNQARITRVDNEQQLLSRWRVGEDPYAIYGLVSDGFFKDDADVASLDQTALIPWGALDIVPGWMKYVDQDKNGKIELPLTGNDMRDFVVIGNSNSRFRYGLNLDFDWSGFDLGVFIQGVGKRDYYPADYMFWGAYQQPYANYYPWLLDFYRPTSDDATTRSKHSAEYIRLGLADQNLNSKYPVLQSWLADSREDLGLDIPQTKYLLNAAYLRVKNLTLGYTLPKQMIKRFGMSSLRFFVTGENLFEVSSMGSYFDPEAVATDGYSYPFMRKYSVGLQVNF